MNRKLPLKTQQKSPSKTRELIGENPETLDMILEEEIANQVSARIKTILLVDDDNLVLDITTKVLKREGYDVKATQFPEKALEIIKNDTDNTIDLVISDIMMPRMNGVELVSAIRQTRSKISVLFISGYIDKSQINIGKNDLLLNKPFSILDLRTTVAGISKTRGPKQSYQKGETPIPNERMNA